MYGVLNGPYKNRNTTKMDEVRLPSHDTGLTTCVPMLICPRVLPLISQTGPFFLIFD